MLKRFHNLLQQHSLFPASRANGLTKRRGLHGALSQPLVPDHLSRGASAERAAQHYLEHQGLLLVCNNYRCKYGEIDLIMWDAPSLVFVEVRYRQHPHFGGAASSIDRRKQQKLIRSAQQFLLQPSYQPNPACRFDVIAFNGGEKTEHLSWIKNAFSS